jgi:DeoR/GlpR family transcriptional regulator of sugar metabolism
VTERGYFNSDMMLVESEKAMLATADQAVVVTDSSKFGKVSLSRLCRLDEVHAVVTDTNVDSAWKERLESEGVGLVLASAPTVRVD